VGGGYQLAAGAALPPLVLDDEEAVATGFCAIRSYLATAAKHGITFINALTALAEGRPWLPEPA